MAEQVERGLPVSTDAEQGVLAAILVDNSKYRSAGELSAEQFGIESHRRIFRCMADMIDVQQRNVDIITLCNELDRRKELESVGGHAYISSLDRPALFFRQHIDIVLQKWRSRRIIEACNLAMMRAYDQQESPDEVLAELTDHANKIIAAAPDTDADIFVGASQFVGLAHREIEWRVHRIIEVGTSGFIIGLPKSGKTPLATDLAVSLATGTDWLGFAVKRARTALVAREDYAGTTARRISRLMRARGIPERDLYGQDWLFVNSRAQSQTMMLDNPRDLATLIKNLKRREIEFLILDVLNVLHNADENDNTEMRGVLKRIEQIRDEVGCQVCILHHARKGVDEHTPLSEVARGSTAISGFAEFTIGVAEVDETSHTRRLRFNCKAAEAWSPVYFRMCDVPSDGGLVVEQCEYDPNGDKPKRKWQK